MAVPAPKHLRRLLRHVSLRSHELPCRERALRDQLHADPLDASAHGVQQPVDGPDSHSKRGLKHVVLVPRADGGADLAEDERDGVRAVLEVVDRPLEGARGLGCCQRVLQWVAAEGLVAVLLYGLDLAGLV